MFLFNLHSCIFSPGGGGGGGGGRTKISLSISFFEQLFIIFFKQMTQTRLVISGQSGMGPLLLKNLMLGQ